MNDLHEVPCIRLLHLEMLTICINMNKGHKLHHRERIIMSSIHGRSDNLYTHIPKLLKQLSDYILQKYEQMLEYSCGKITVPDKSVQKSL